MDLFVVMRREVEILCIVCGFGVAVSAAGQPIPSTMPAEVPSTQPALAMPKDVTAELGLAEGKLMTLTDELDFAPSEQRKEIISGFDTLADEAVSLAQKARSPHLRLRARQLELEVYETLLQAAERVDDPRERAFRLSQVRAAAYGVKQMSIPGSRAVGTFWVALADLHDIKHSNLPLLQQQFAAAECLKRVMAELRTEDADSSEKRLIESALRQAMLVVDDERGLAARATEPSDAIHAGVDSLLDVGDVLDVELATINGQKWSAAAHRGQVVLIHFWAAWDPLSESVLMDLKKLRAEVKPEELHIVSVVVDSRPHPSRIADVSWPVCRDGQGDQSLRQLLRVRAIPWFALIDRQGRLVAVGGQSLTAMERLRPLLVVTENAVSPISATQPTKTSDVNRGIPTDPQERSGEVSPAKSRDRYATDPGGF